MRGHYKNTVPPRRGGTVYAHARICLLPEFYGVANVRSIMVSDSYIKERTWIKYVPRMPTVPQSTLGLNL